ncbi:MAG: glutamate-1-semialdehyde 2,1-aminomutase [Calditrichaeota bacterium]|nr:glutamate-1-semialdehyde 2,1-aminomutase [Calditrichota bacterium]MCB9369831.1 glutamate-1-semialdehyde 2,1-aminomutase [Calditrichota bacterium]
MSNNILDSKTEHSTTISRSWNERAKKVLPGGVNSPVRAFKSVGGEPPVIAYAEGAVLVDVDGNEYIDYIGSWGPMILGHREPSVVDAVHGAVDMGFSYGAPSPAEVNLAEDIVSRVPGIEMVRFVNSGTEATMSAIRLARAATKRSVIIKFSGGYHGHADSFLVQAGSGAATFGLPDSPGVTPGAAQDTRCAVINDLDSVRVLFETDPESIAAVIVEPVAGNVGCIPPDFGFLGGLRALCDEFGALLIFDEVMTGFRVARGGAIELFNILPDLATFGKVIGGGLPVGAYGGKKEIMSLVAPQGPVYQAGTLSGNPLAMKAGLATLAQLDDSAYRTLEKKSARLAEGLLIACKELEIPAVVQRVGSMLTLFFTDKPVNNYADAQKCDHARFKKFFHAMLERGVHLPPSGYECWFVSLAHSDDHVERTIEIAKEALAATK